MSEVHDTRLVADGHTGHERLARGVVAGSLLAVVLAVGTLFGWVPVEGTVGGVPAPAAFGGGVVALGAAVGLLGVHSRWGGAVTTPDRTPGLGVGLLQAVLWTATAGLVAGNTLGFGRVGWLAALGVGLAVGYVTLGLREDLGATVPLAVFVCLVGALLLTGVIGPDWTWEPEGFDATIPGTLAIALLTMFSGLLTGWASASAAEGFGTRGRQHGAFLLISVVVLLVLAVLGFLLLFVTERGIGVVAENLTVEAGLAFLAGATFLARSRSGRLARPTARGTAAIGAFLGLAGTLAVGLACLAFLGVVLSGDPVSGYAITVEPTPVVGAVPGLLVAAVLLATNWRAWRSWTPASRLGQRVDRGLAVAVVILGLLAAIEVVTATELAVTGLSLLPTLAGLTAALAVGSLLLGGWFARRETSDSPPWLPPASRASGVALWAFGTVCLHVTFTGYSLFAGPLGLVTGGAVDWPFLMNASQGLGIQRGVMPAMFGTIWIVVGAIVFAVPLAVGAAVYLTEYAEDSLFTSAVDVATNGLWSTPSIVFGLFGLAFLVPRFGGGPSIFAAQLVLGFMLLPLVLITSREAMKSVPDEYRDASAALGVSQWQTIRSVVIPAAMPGVITGAILGVGRIAGETAPLLLVLNGPNFPTSGPGIIAGFSVDLGLAPPFVEVTNPALMERASALPYQLYAVITAGVGAEESFGWGTALVLLGVVLSFFAMGVASRRYFRKKLHQ